MVIAVKYHLKWTLISEGQKQLHLTSQTAIGNYHGHGICLGKRHKHIPQGIQKKAKQNKAYLSFLST